MRNRYRSACGYLLFKKWYYTAPAAENIAEADSHDLCFLLFLGKRLNDHLRYFFSRTHNACRVHGFIRGDHNEPVDAVFDRELGHIFSSADIIFYRLFRVVLHKRDVFICRSMKDHGRIIFFEDIFHFILFFYIGDNRYYFNRCFIRVVFVQLHLHVVNGVFSLSDQYHRFGFES